MSFISYSALNPNSSKFTVDIKTKTLSSIIASLKGDAINEHFKCK